MLDVLKMLYPTSPAPPERRCPRPSPAFPSGAAAAHRAMPPAPDATTTPAAAGRRPEPPRAVLQELQDNRQRQQPGLVKKLQKLPPEDQLACAIDLAQLARSAMPHAPASTDHLILHQAQQQALAYARLASGAAASTAAGAGSGLRLQPLAQELGRLLEAEERRHAQHLAQFGRLAAGWVQDHPNLAAAAGEAAADVLAKLPVKALRVHLERKGLSTRGKKADLVARLGGLSRSVLWDCHGRKTSRFRGVSKEEGSKAKPWTAEITVSKDGKRRSITIAYFAREEDAARARDRVSIAKLGHVKAKTNFPVAMYRAEWAELEALGVDRAVAAVRKATGGYRTRKRVAKQR